MFCGHLSLIAHSSGLQLCGGDMRKTLVILWTTTGFVLFATVVLVCLGLFGGFASARVRQITYVVVAPCDMVDSHFSIKDGRITQNHPVSEVLIGIPQEKNGVVDDWAKRFNEATLYVSIDSWLPSDWEIGAYILAALPHEFGISPVNPFHVCLYEDWNPKKAECVIGKGPWTDAMFNRYIIWHRGSDPFDKWPTKEECRKKLGIMR